MDTLQHELELAVPHVDPGPDGLDELVVAGRRAVRRRRAGVGGVLAVGGLVVAAVVGVGNESTRPDRQEARDPAVATAPGASRPDAPTATRTSRVPLTLTSMLEVAGECPRRAGGGDPRRVVELRAEGRWSAVELACGKGTVRVLQTPVGELVGHYRVERRRTLEEWAEANVDRVVP